MAGYIKDTDVYALFQPNGTAYLHVADIDRLPRTTEGIYCLYDSNWLCEKDIDVRCFSEKSYNSVLAQLEILGREKYEEKHKKAIKELEDHKSELDMLLGIRDTASNSEWYKNNRGRVEQRINELPQRIRFYTIQLETLEDTMERCGYSHFAGYKIKQMEVADYVDSDNIKDIFNG